MQRSLDDYVDVATRIQRFYEKYPQGSIESEILTDDGKRVVVKASANYWTEDGRLIEGNGHAEEIRGQGMVNKTSALENCETSAWGRALAALGFETKNGIASRQEMEKVERMTAKPEPARLTAPQIKKLQERVKDADPQKVQLMLIKSGVDQLADLTAKQAGELVKAVA